MTEYISKGVERRALGLPDPPPIDLEKSPGWLKAIARGIAGAAPRVRNIAP